MDTYSISVGSGKGTNFNYSVFYSKQYGDNHGGVSSFNTKEEVIEFIKSIIREWEGFDNILNRNGDKVTKKNLTFFSAFDSIVSINDVFGDNKLLKWIEVKLWNK